MWNEVLEDLIVVKRSGQRVNFNASKIAIAIKNAFESVYEDADEKKVYKVFERVLNYINDNYKGRKTINVEDVQDIIEEKLKQEKCLDVYNSFNEYRTKRALSRKVFAEKQQHKFVKAIEKIQENNNLKTDSYLSPYNTLYKFGRIVSSEYNKSYVLDSKFVRGAEEGNIYIHDLDYFGLGLLSSVHLKLKFDDDNESIDDLINMVINAQNEINGEIGINKIDSLLSPWFIDKYHKTINKYLYNYLKVCGYLEFVNYKKIEDLTNKEEVININSGIYQQFLLNNNLKNIFDNAINDAKTDLFIIIKKTITRLFTTLESNHQRETKFSISLGLEKSDIGNLINNAIYNLLIESDAFNYVSVIYKIRKNDKELINQVSNLILNKKNVCLVLTNEKDIEYFSNGARIYDNYNDNEKLSTGRMIVNTTSINLARLGLKYRNKHLKEFFEELDQISELAKNELLLAFETVGNKNEANYKVLFNGNIFEDEKLEGNQKIRKVIKNGLINIGLIGLKECVICLESDQEKQYNLIIEILNEMNKKCLKYMEESKLNFGLFEPSDYKSRKCLIGIDKAIYGINPYITDKNYYELIDTLKGINGNYLKLSKIQKLFTSGEEIVINLPNNVTSKKINDLINNLIDADMGFARLKVGK